MPFFFLLFMSATGQDEDRSWRLTYLIPLLMHILSMAMSLSSQDLPTSGVLYKTAVCVKRSTALPPR